MRSLARNLLRASTGAMALAVSACAHAPPVTAVAPAVGDEKAPAPLALQMVTGSRIMRRVAPADFERMSMSQLHVVTRDDITRVGIPGNLALSLARVDPAVSAGP